MVLRSRKLQQHHAHSISLCRNHQANVVRVTSKKKKNGKIHSKFGPYNQTMSYTWTCNLNTLYYKIIEVNTVFERNNFFLRNIRTQRMQSRKQSTKGAENIILYLLQWHFTKQYNYPCLLCIIHREIVYQMKKIITNITIVLKLWSK